MCLAVVARDVHPRYAVVLAANRDEFHFRPAQPAHWWDDGDLLAGRDVLAGGTWLGVSRAGRFAFVTNVRDPGRNDPAAPTRGTLVPRVLRDPRPVADAVRSAVADATRMNGFNLLAGSITDAAWGSNRAAAVQVLGAGVHGLSNAALDTPWPKLVHTRDAVAAWARRADEDVEGLFAVLADRRVAPDDRLPRTGVTLDRERMLSAAFIAAPDYGTRCSTVLLLDRSGHARFVERSFDAAGAPTSQVDEHFTVETRPRVAA